MSAASTRIESGSCFCGAVVAQATGEPFWICYDHDDDCRKAIGGGVNIWVGYRPDDIAFGDVAPKSFSRTPGVTRTFCGACGSSIGYHDEALPDETYLTIGFLDHPENFVPQAHAYWDLKLPFVEMNDDLPRIGTYSRTRDASLGTPAARQRAQRGNA